MLKDIADFHDKFGLKAPPTPRLLDPETMIFRLRFMREELDETEEAAAAGDMPAFADGLIDLLYVVLGTLHLSGLPTQALWDEVHRANMRKERATREDQSARRSTLDVIKPPRWTPPDIVGVLRAHGWEQPE